MVNPIANTKECIHTLVSASLGQAMQSGALRQAEELPAFTVEIPADTSHGDFAVNAAMVSAKTFGCAPRAIAQAIIDHLSLDGTNIERVEIAGPGFINFFVCQSWFSSVVSDVVKHGENYGRTDYGKDEKVQVEFISANPTGPMHMGNARGGAIGDCLAAALDWAGYQVEREFYINDAGNQIEKFAVSLDARYRQLFLGADAVPFPEDGYQGEDIIMRAKEFSELHGDQYLNMPEEARKKALVEFALPKNIEKIRCDLERYRIHYDVWFPESKLHNGAVEDAVAMLTAHGMTYEKEGALWYKATKFGAEKDEVLVRANGFPTYFAADIAYHYNKFHTRGFDRVINVWGADHHGHVARLKGAMDAIGLDGNRLDIVLMQLVRLTRNGKLEKMSKRTGKAVSLTDLLDEVPIDAVRFLFNMREPNSQIDFDLDLAIKETPDNPVYYVQYAHARICSIIRRLASKGTEVRQCTPEELSLLTAKEERELIRTLAGFPQVIVDSVKSYNPAMLTKCATDIASLFHKFYQRCRVDGEEEALMQARLNLCHATKTVLCNLLTMMKISAPEALAKEDE